MKVDYLNKKDTMFDSRLVWLAKLSALIMIPINTQVGISKHFLLSLEKRFELLING